MKRILLLLQLFPLALQAQTFMPADHRALTKSISYAQMETFLESVDGRGPVRVSVAGRTTQGRAVYLVRLSRTATPAWKILFYAQQHGDELSGKDALLYLIRDIAAHPEQLPEDVGVWIMPMMNPDGAEAGTRVNGAGVDINRDHLTLDQPESLALHQVVRSVRPDIAVDCHEFAREPQAWRQRGWAKWPEITMDRLNNPLFEPSLFAAGDRWLAGAAEAQAAAGYAFARYTVGGVPPDEEQRHSAPETDSAMNAVGTYGGLSFIIEVGARGGEEAVARELGRRVDACLVLLRRFVAGGGRREEDRAAILASRARALPPFLPVNYFWVNAGGRVTRVPVLETATGRTIEVATANLMTEVAVKRSVPAPLGYAIEPSAAAVMGALLDRHGIPRETVTEPREVEAERCTLVRVEEESDEVYSRYEGRQIVRRAPAAKTVLPAGSLWVPLRGESAVRAALVLEPASLYGLFQYGRYRALAGEGGSLPVLRVLH